MTRRAAQPVEYLLASLFGLDERAPFGALRRAGSGEAANTRHWLAADAVHLRFARDALLLTDAPDVAPDADEAAALAASWNAHFANVGWLYLGAGGHGHLALHEALDAGTTPPGGALGRKIDVRMPTGPDGAKLRQWMNETQMLFHGHAVNAAREEAGKPAINSLWFWGAGAAPVRAQARCLQVWTDNTLARGLALAAGVRAAPLPAHSAIALLPDNLIVLDAALQPSLYLDFDGWAAAVSQIERAVDRTCADGAQARRRADPDAHADRRRRATRRHGAAARPDEILAPPAFPHGFHLLNRDRT
jgi:hypothetical protein